MVRTDRRREEAAAREGCATKGRKLKTSSKLNQIKARSDVTS